jgi:hypothetical protein
MFITQYPAKKLYSSIGSLYNYPKSQQVTYRELKTLNPWLHNTKLTVPQGKSYRLQLPVTSGQHFDELFKNAQ